MQESERNEIKVALGELGATIQRAFVDNDVETYLSAFDEDAVTSLPGSPPMRGHNALRNFFENRPGFPPGATFSIQPLEIEPLCPDWGYAYGTDVIALPDGSTQTMTFLVLLRRTENGWKTFREVVSADQ